MIGRAISLRPASPEDFGYCAGLYFAEMDRTLTDLGVDRTARRASFEGRWRWDQVRVIQRDRSDVGWLQTERTGEALFIAQLFVETSCQRQGVGTEVLELIFEEARLHGSPVTLGVVKTNPALRLYQRLGFRVTHDDSRKFYMTRDPVA